MSVRIMSAVWDIAGLTATQKIVLLSLADQSNDDGVCYPSAVTTSKRTGLCERSTRSTIADLEKSGHLSRKIQSGKPTIYRIHPCIKCTPASDAPLSEMQGLEPRPLHLDSLTPASDSNITISEPKIKDKESCSPSVQPLANGTRLAPDWQLPDGWRFEALEIGVEHYQIFVEAEKFRDYWHGVAGAKGRKADWRATWRNWVRRSLENNTRNMSHAERKHAFAERNARRDYSPASAKSF